MSLQRIRALPCWQGTLRAESLSGGLSNESWKVTDDAGAHVVRLGEDFPFHHVFRDREAVAARAAAAAGFAPRVEHTEPGVMVCAFVAARTWTEADMRANPARIAALLREFHTRTAPLISGPAPFFWVFHVIRDYAETLRAARSDHSGALPALLEMAAEMEAVQVPLPIVFGHHDLLPGNFLDDGDKLWLIDFEYAGFGTAMFDLAGAASNAQMDDAMVQELLAGYFGRSPDAATMRAFDAMQCVALAREAMWAMVSEIHLNVPGADYRAHAAEYLGRLDAALDGYRSKHGKNPK